MRWRFEGLPDAAARLAEALRRLAAGVTVQRRGERALELGPAVGELALCGEHALLCCCRIQRQGTPRPQEILRELLGLDEEQAGEVRIIRVGWVAPGGELPPPGKRAP